MRPDRTSRSTGILLRYGVILSLNLFSLAAFLAVIAIGLSLHSGLVTVIGSVLSAVFLAQCAYLIRTGKEGWNARLGRGG